MSTIGRTRLFSILFTLLHCVMAVPWTDAASAAQPQGEYFASTNASLVRGPNSMISLGVEAGISRTNQRGVSIRVHAFPEFSASCYVEPQDLRIPRSLKSASMVASCQVQNTYEYWPTSYEVNVTVNWKANGPRERNQQNHGVGQPAKARITATVTGPSGEVISVRESDIEGYLAFIPLKKQ